MKAAVLYEVGKPLVIESEIGIPLLMQGQVLVKLTYSGVCRSQLMEVRGSCGEDPWLPHLLGHEIVLINLLKMWRFRDTPYILASLSPRVDSKIPFVGLQTRKRNSDRHRRS